MGKSLPSRRLACVVRADVRKIAEWRRQVYGVVPEAKHWMPVLAAVLLRADEGKYFIRNGPLVVPRTWPGLTHWSLYRELREIGIEADLNDPAIDDASPMHTVTARDARQEPIWVAR